VSLTHARLPHVTSQEVITVAAKLKRQDITLQGSCQLQCGLRPRSGSSTEGPGAG
jgi:hypothetical protein